MSTKVGDRVYAVLSASQESVKLFGFGVYEGDHIPEEGATFFGVALTWGNPRIRLDSGQVVYGFECWWGKESAFESFAAGREIEYVDIDEERAKHRPIF